MSGLMGDSARGTSGRTAAKTSTLQASYRVTTAVEGLCIPILYGRNGLQANIFFAWGWAPVAQAAPSQSMGKGGGKPSGGAQYVYTIFALLGLCEGILSAIGRYWWDKTRMYQFSAAGLAAARLSQTDSPWKTRRFRQSSLSGGHSGEAGDCRRIFKLLLWDKKTLTQNHR